MGQWEGLQESLQIHHLPYLKGSPSGVASWSSEPHPHWGPLSKREEGSVGLRDSSRNISSTCVFPGLDFEAHTQGGRRKRESKRLPCGLCRQGGFDDWLRWKPLSPAFQSPTEETQSLHLPLSGPLSMAALNGDPKALTKCISTLKVEQNSYPHPAPNPQVTGKMKTPKLSTWKEVQASWGMTAP